MNRVICSADRLKIGIGNDWMDLEPENLASRIKDAGIAIRHSRRYIISILQGLEMAWRGLTAVPPPTKSYKIMVLAPWGSVIQKFKIPKLICRSPLATF